MITCAEAMAARDRRWVEVAGLVLVRQRPGSANGVMFITIEDETGVANLVVGTKTFEANRRVVLGAGMLGVRRRIQREGEVVHLVAHTLTDLSQELASAGRRDVAAGNSGAAAASAPLTHPATKVRDIYIPDLRSHAIRVKTRDFR